jgi:hypothetical protein
MLRSATSAFTRVFDAPCLAAWCAGGHSTSVTAVLSVDDLVARIIAE